MKKILVAEDDKFLASAYKLKLVKEGFDVVIVKACDAENTTISQSR